MFILHKTPLLSNSLLPRNIYIFLFSLLGVVYVCGLFVPLMDDDSAHHANIALRMHLTGNYVNLIDHGKDYLDKPHLLFWLCAISYKLFGVTAFAYKLPSFLFSLLGIYSTYRLGKSLYNMEAGKLAALALASALAFILANNDVRMDAILTACAAFATWQLIEFIQQKKLKNVLGAALGLALGFSTKGHIAILVPAIATLFFILYRKDWKLFINPKWFLLLLLFALFISPVVYCYYLQFNLHPEKVVRGKDHINGVKFILLNQSTQRFGGEMGEASKNDHFFFIHSFLWAFLPWSVIVFVATARRIKNFLRRKEEWATTAVFILMVLILSFSGFKLPHYLNIIFPAAAIITAVYLYAARDNPKRTQFIYLAQYILSVAVVVLVSCLVLWAFPIKNRGLIIPIILFLTVFFYFIISKNLSRLQKAICLSVSSTAFCFFLLNTAFYPQLLNYQGGNEMAKLIKGKVDPSAVYSWGKTLSPSFYFYTKTLRQQFADSVLANNKSVWILFDIKDEEGIKQSGYRLGQRFETNDFHITKLDLKFVNPATRENQCSKMVVAEILR